MQGWSLGDLEKNNLITVIIIDLDAIILKTIFFLRIQFFYNRKYLVHPIFGVALKTCIVYFLSAFIKSLISLSY